MARTPTEIRSLARSHAPMAMAVLAGIARQKTAQAAARVAACKEILERGYGKAETNHELNADIQVTIRTLLDPDAQPVTKIVKGKVIEHVKDDGTNG